MLVLSRKKNEQIVIGDSIQVTVVEIRGDKVRFGLQIPNDIPVHRREVYDAIQAQSAEEPGMKAPPRDSPPGDSTIARPAPEYAAFDKLPILVLSRQRDEQIVIGDSIVITAVDIRGDKVRIGLQYPKEMSAHRREVYDAIKKEELP